MYVRVRALGVAHRDEAEEITQEVFVRVLSRIAASDHREPIVREYLVRAAEHLVADRRRQQIRRGPADTLDETAADAVPASMPTPEEQAVMASDAASAYEALRRLPDLEQRVLRLRIVDELSAEAVGAIIGKNAAAVRQIQHRAIVRLRRLFEES